MKRNKLTRILATLSVLCLTMGSLAGCGGEPSQESTPTSKQEESSQTGGDAGTSQDSGTEEPQDTGVTFPLAEQVELTIATPDGNVASLADNLPVWEEIQKRTNIKINWDVTASKEYVNIMKTRMGAGGGKLPDILLLPNGMSLAELGGDGRILPLEDYIANSENIQKVYEQFPNV